MDVVAELIQAWTRAGVAFGPGASESKLAAFESRYRLALPEDFRRYLRSVNGTGMGYDDDFYHFAPLYEIEPVARSWGVSQQGIDHFEGCFVFADWAIHCWDYAIQLAGPAHEVGRVFCVETSESRSEPMARSFADWLSTYLQGGDRVAPGAGRA